jgi:hypothetical protein
MKSEILVTLIKEVVKNEVKNQVKEELAKLIKSGAVTLNSQKKTSTPSLRELTEVPTTQVRKQQPVQQVQQRQAPQRFNAWSWWWKYIRCNPTSKNNGGRLGNNELFN